MKGINTAKVLRGQLHDINGKTSENTGKVIDIETAARYLQEVEKIMNGMARNESDLSESFFFSEIADSCGNHIERLKKKAQNIHGDSIALDRAASELRKEYNQK